MNNCFEFSLLETKSQETEVWPAWGENVADAIRKLSVDLAQEIKKGGAEKVSIIFDGKDTLNFTRDDETAEIKITGIKELIKEEENGGFSIHLGKGE